jgi:MFS family permease
LEAIFPNPPVWWLLRGLTGLCFAGILTVIESWINFMAPNEKRGRILATYTILNFGVIVLGQQLLGAADPATFHLFSLSAILFSVAGIPLALTLTPPPISPRRPAPRPAWLWKMSPAAFIGCLGAGLANGAFWGLGPVYAIDAGLPASLVATFMSSAVVGGALAQWPLGKLSDKTDRRSVLIVISVSASVLGLLLFLFSSSAFGVKLTLAFLFGASALPVYWVSVAHANDYASAAQSVDVSSNLLLVFASGAIFGPILASGAIAIAGSSCIFLYTALIHALLAGFVLHRTLVRGPAPAETRDEFVALPDKTSPALFELDPRAEAAPPQRKPTTATHLRLVSTTPETTDAGASKD